jgi:tetratricopeptide (TPR) repeat protein
LASADRATLQAAAVLGDPIDVNVLSNILGEAVPSLEKSIAKLKEHDFVVDRGPSELRFVSPIVPEIVADALPLEAAREMHAAAGQALETTLGPRAVEHAARIATHLYEAGDRERAASYFAKSGERRLETRQLEAAARDYARAITLADPARRSPEEFTNWLIGLASAVRVVRSLSDVSELCQRVIERADHGADGAEGREVRVNAYVAAAHIFTAVQQIADAQQRLGQAEALAADDVELRKPVLIAGAELANRQGKFERAWQLLTELRRMGAIVTNEREKWWVALLAAQASAGRGDREAALLSLLEAEHLLPDDRMAAVERTRVRALVDHFTKDFRSAVLHGEMAVDLAREAGLTYEVMFNLHNLGVVFIRLDEPTRAYGAVRQSLELCEESAYERFANFNRMLLAFLDGLEGTADADKLLLVGIAYAESKRFTMEVVTGYLLLAKLLHRRGRLQEAEAEYERAGALALDAGHRIVVDECEEALAALRSSFAV